MPTVISTSNLNSWVFNNVISSNFLDNTIPSISVLCVFFQCLLNWECFYSWHWHVNDNWPALLSNFKLSQLSLKSNVITLFYRDGLFFLMYLPMKLLWIVFIYLCIVCIVLIICFNFSFIIELDMCDAHDCSHNCTPAPDGYICLCPPNKKLLPDNKTCAGR